MYISKNFCIFALEIQNNTTMSKKKEQVEITKVIFRKYKDGEVIALMPEEEWSDGCVTSYLHIGQHAEADYNKVIRDTKPATVDEYASLYNELKRVGYLRLQVIQRRPRKG